MVGTFLGPPIASSSARSFSFGSTPRVPDLSSASGSTPSTSSNDDGSGTPEDEGQEVWDVVDSMYTRRVDGDGRVTYARKISSDLTIELDGATFGVDPSTNRVPLKFPRPPGSDEMDIPHFPELTDALLVSSGARTSEPINTGIQHETEKESMGHITRERFQTLLDSQLGTLRFREWVGTEGYSGSKALFQYYLDACAHVSLIEEISIVTEVMEGIYFGPAAPVSWAHRLLTTRPAGALYALESASLGMHNAQTEAFDKLYAAEFKRFIAGKISSHARFCLEHFADWHDRGDLGEVFSLADPNLPDQPLVMVSDGFCRLSEYPRERLLGRNCRFLQGPATDPEAVRLLRQAITEGREHCSMLMNYTRTGKAFWNLFNMIPLRNPDGGIDYFLGAQVDCSRALTTPATFKALTGIAEQDSGTPAMDPRPKFAYSQELLHGTDCHPESPTLLRKIAPATSEADDASVKTPRYVRADGNRHYRIKIQTLNPLPPPSQDPLEPIPIPQEVPNPVRDHMSAFSFAYSKLLVFDASTRRIMYITAPLLATLGYPVRTSQDRLSPRILQTDVLDLVTGPTSAEGTSFRRTISQVVEDRGTHSLFVVLAPPNSKRLSSISEEASDRDSLSDEDFIRSLLHLTPLKDIHGTASMYVGVVG